jgi:hypothetical protein
LHRAQLELARLVSEHKAGLSIDPSKISMTELLDRWNRDHAELRAENPRALSQIIKNQIKPNLGAVVIQKLRPVADFYAKLQIGGLAPRTVGDCHRLLHRALGHAATWAPSRRTSKPP